MSYQEPPVYQPGSTGSSSGSSTGSSTFAGGGAFAGGGGSDDRSIGEVFSAVSADLSTLMRQEVALAKAEVRQSATQAGAGAGMLGGAGLAGYFVLLFLSIAAWWAIGSWINLGWSAVVVAVVWGVIGAVLYTMGRNRLKQVEGLPRTTETAKHIPNALAGNEETS